MKFDRDRYSLCLDSGAYSLYSKYKNIIGDGRYSFMRSAEFGRYLEDFLEYNTVNANRFDFIANVDILYNPEASYKIWKYLLDNGLMTMPVVHHGTPFSWLKKYLKYTDRVAIGGVGRNVSVGNFVEYADSFFKYICDKNGSPQVKVHGFAVTTPRLLKRYPFWSVDSSTWTTNSRTGYVLVPKVDLERGELVRYRYLESPMRWRFSERRNNDKDSYVNATPLVKRMVTEYLDSNFGHLDLDLNTYMGREIANAHQTLMMGKKLDEYYQEKFSFAGGGNIYLAGTPTVGGVDQKKVRRLWAILQATLPGDVMVRYLATFWAVRQTSRALSLKSRFKKKEIKA